MGNGGTVRVIALETIRWDERPSYLWLRLYTDAGAVGLGEAQRDVDAVEAHLHASAAPLLLGRDPCPVEAHVARLLSGYLGFGASSAEVRAAGAADVALWDLLGRLWNQPLHALLGGRVRDSVPAYNTCASDGYNRLTERRVVRPGDPRPAGPLDDQAWWVHAADELAHSLLEDGFSGMKIWPFDIHALDGGGSLIGAAALRAGLDPFERVRRSLGDRMDLMCELHSLWSVPAARRIAAALEPVAPAWIEDPVARMDNVPAVAEVARGTCLPVAGGETLAGLPVFRDLLASGSLGIAILDVGWCGGLCAARRIAALAEAWGRPVAPHDCSGPVMFAASTHLALHLPGTAAMECVRAFLRGWYGTVATGLPRVSAGRVHAPETPGHGVTLLPGFTRRAGVHVRRTVLDGATVPDSP